jgi:hypothetical protein
MNVQPTLLIVVEDSKILYRKVKEENTYKINLSKKIAKLAFSEFKILL